MLGAERTFKDEKTTPLAPFLRGSSTDALSDISCPTTIATTHNSHPALGRTTFTPSLLNDAKAGTFQEEEELEEGELVNGDSRQLDDSDGHTGLLSSTVPITPASLAGRFLVRWPTIASVAVTLYDLLLRCVCERDLCVTVQYSTVQYSTVQYTSLEGPVCVSDAWRDLCVLQYSTLAWRDLCVTVQYSTVH